MTSNYYVDDGSGYPGFYEGYANVLLGAGTGSFAAPIATWLGFYAHRSAAVADFDGDGKLDFAAINEGWSIGGEYAEVTVLRGAGDGTFGYPDSFDVGTNPRALTADDLNQDGNIDLVMADNDGTSVGVLLGDGLGSFGSCPELRRRLSTPGRGAGRLQRRRHDGPVSHQSKRRARRSSVMLGSGAGVFRPPLTIVTGASPFYIAVGDFNGDGRPDAVSANPNSNNVSVLLNNGDWPTLDQPSITINNATVTEGNTGTVNANFTVSLSAAYSQTVSVHYATADGSATRGERLPGRVGGFDFAPGVTSQNITVLVNGDRLGEYTGVYSESFFVRLSDATNAFLARASGLGDDSR